MEENEFNSPVELYDEVLSLTQKYLNNGLSLQIAHGIMLGVANHMNHILRLEYDKHETERMKITNNSTETG